MAVTVADRRSTDIAVATDASVTPAHATSACRMMSPEQACVPSPPVAGCSPATTSPETVGIVAVSCPWSTTALAVLVIRALSGSAL